MIRRDLYPTGRKHCTKCGRWRHVWDFYLANKRRGILQSHCRTCSRVTIRHDAGIRRRGEPYAPQQRVKTAGIPRSHNGTIVYVSDGYRAYQRSRYRNLTPEQRENIREGHRFYQEARRRAAGIVPRNLARPVPRDEAVQLPAGPFAEWLREHMPAVGGLAWAQGRGLADDANLRRIRDGIQTSVHIDTVDRVVGPVVLNELYPVEEPVAA